MKITKRQLRRIIAEEKQKILNEANPSGAHVKNVVEDSTLNALAAFVKSVNDDAFNESEDEDYADQMSMLATIDLMISFCESMGYLQASQALREIQP